MQEFIDFQATVQTGMPWNDVKIPSMCHGEFRFPVMAFVYLQAL